MMYIQSFTSCMHGYNSAHNVHPNSITHAQKFVHGMNNHDHSIFNFQYGSQNLNRYSKAFNPQSFASLS